MKRLGEFFAREADAEGKISEDDNIHRPTDQEDLDRFVRCGEIAELVDVARVPDRLHEPESVAEVGLDSKCKCKM